MDFSRPISFNRNPITSNRKLRNFGYRVIMSLGVPIVFSLIAIILAYSANNTLFISASGGMGTVKNIMSFVNSIVMTLVAALALNSNLNSGRMDFSLGATGILAALLASFIVPGLRSVNEIFLFLFLTIIFGMVLGLINSMVFIFLKLPPIVMSLGMCLVFEGIAKIFLILDPTSASSGSKTILYNDLTSNFFLEPIIIFPILAVVMVIMSAMFCYTKFGYNKNALVYDQKISVDTGINEITNCIVCFVMAGALIGLYQVLDICGQSQIQIKTDLGSSTTVFRNFLPIFIGGILAKYSNQIVGLTLAVFSTTILTTGMDAATSIGFTADIQSLLNGLMVFAVLVYMVDKQRFKNWLTMQRYIFKEKRLYPNGKEEE